MIHFFSRVFWPEYIYLLISSIEAEKSSDIDEQDDKSENQPPSTSSPVKNENSTHNPIIIPDLENNSPNISSNPTSSSISVGSAIVQRSSCPYGSDCNRKNPIHFQSEAHPGDSDFREEPEQNSNLFFFYTMRKNSRYISHFFSYIGIYFSLGIDPENDPRPECEYGLDCYRKNPQHKKDFKHNNKPRPKRKVKDEAAAKAKKAKKLPNNADDDENDYDSSFIDDDDTDEADISNDEESVDEWTPDDDD